MDKCNIRDGNPSSWAHNESADSVTADPIIPTTLNLQYGDRIQFFADPANTSAEIVYIKNNNVAMIAKKLE